MEYRPEDDAGVQELDSAGSDNERRDHEADLMKESDNGLKPGDPEPKNVNSR